MASYYIYILSSRSRTLYVGVTNHLVRRVFQHKEGSGGQFTQKYSVGSLVYFEEYESVRDAIAREKQLKGWVRARKVALIETMNPNWDDLSLRF